MQIQLGSLVSEPWFVTALALAAVTGDALLPFLPSGSLVIAAALLCLDHGGAPIALVIAVAVASFLGDLVVVALARGGSARVDVLFVRHAKLASGAGRLSRHLARRLPAATVAGRFVPAGRTVLGLTLGTQSGQRARYLRWSAVGGLAWACYLVGLGVVNGLWFETRWIGFAVSTAAAVTLSTCLARSLRRRATAEGSLSSQAGGLEDSAGRVRVDAPGEAPQIVIAGAQGSPRTGVPYALLHRVPPQRSAGQHARGDVHPAARVVAQEHPRGDTLGPLGGNEAVHRRAVRGRREPHLWFQREHAAFHGHSPPVLTVSFRADASRQGAGAARALATGVGPGGTRAVVALGRAGLHNLEHLVSEPLQIEEGGGALHFALLSVGSAERTNWYPASRADDHPSAPAPGPDFESPIDLL
ncbi:MAG TPA: hypothetical protein VK545_25860 [Streptomyces sp.]|nr:hypothetical protein [Streptomyces sp.]